MTYKERAKQEAIRKENEMTELYCNNCNTIHRINQGNLIFDGQLCDKCGHTLCNCDSCKSTIVLIKKGVLTK